MAAFLIVDIEITDPTRYEEYRKLAGPTVGAFGGKYVVRAGRVEALEGEWLPGRLVVLEFPSSERAREWWDSEAYREARRLRQTCARTKMVLVEGV